MREGQDLADLVAIPIRGEHGKGPVLEGVERPEGRGPARRPVRRGSGELKRGVKNLRRPGHHEVSTSFSKRPPTAKSKKTFAQPQSLSYSDSD